MCVKIPSWTDNSGTEAVCGKLFTVVQPLCRFVQQLAMVAWSTAISFDASHIAGCHNDSADWLSRWNQQDPLRESFSLDHRVRGTLDVLWHNERDVRLFPPSAKLLWKPPLASFAKD